jgi:hypothetical protein
VIELTRDNLRRLAVPAAIAAALAGLGIVALVLTDQFATRADKQFENARAGKAAVQSRLARTTEEEREIRARLVDYQALRSRGVLGEERRLDWVEAIKRIKAERGLYDVKYSIEPRRPVDYPGLKQVPGVDVLMSRMKLDAALLHEGDLLNLIADLRKYVAPVVVVRACSIARADGGATPTTAAAGPRLRADCTIDLVTIRDAKESS